MNRSSGRAGGAVVVRVIACAVFAGAIAACGGDSNGVGPDGQVHHGVGVSGTLSVSPTSVTLVQGRSATVTLTLSLKGPSPGAITFASRLSRGVTATYNPPSLNGSGSTTVTLAAASDADIVSTTPFFVGFVGTDTLVLDGLSPSINLTVRNARPNVSVTRSGSGAGTVTSTPAGITCGTVCGAQFDLGPITLTAVPAAGSAFASWSGLCVGTALTCTFTPNDFGNTVTATFVSTAPAIGLAVSPSPVSVQAGGATTATVTLTRINGFADAANLAINAPAGLTVTANPASITGTTSTLTVNAAGSLPAGNYPVTITATGTGVAQQSVSVPVQVPVPAGGGAITFNYANCEATQIPIWFAAQNGTGAWTRVTPAGNAFTFTLGPTGAYAIVTRNGADTTTSVVYASATEIGAIAAANPCGTEAPIGTKRINGTLLNAGSLAGNLVTSVVVGGAEFTRSSDSTNAFSLFAVPGGLRDLIAATKNTRTGINALNLTRMIIRRNTNYSNNQNIPNLDLTGAESFAPPFETLTPLNLGGDQIAVGAALITANGPSARYYSTDFLGPAGNTGFQGLPDSLLRAGDFHDVSMLAAPSTGTDFRFAELLVHSLNTTSPTTISFGPRVSGVAVTSVAIAPYQRLRGQVASQGTYNAGAVAKFTQGGRTVSLVQTAAYVGSSPATWSLDTPDLSTAGYDPAWALKPGANASWEVDAVSGDVLPFLGGNPVNNAQVIVAGARNPGAAFSASRRLRRMPRP